jgi:cytochrome c oxidase cbb3-type subunit III
MRRRMRFGARLWTPLRMLPWKHVALRLAAPLAATTLALLSGCSGPGYPPPPAKTPGQITDFATLYAQNCASCHGRNGQDGPALDLHNPEYLALVDDTSLRKWTADGVSGTEMPAFATSAGGMLTDAQINALVTGMRNAWSRPDALAGPAPPPYAQAKAGDPRRGEQTYQARCAGCHKNSPDEEITSPVYLALVSDQGLRTIILAGRPDISQPDWRHDAPGGKLSTPLTASDVDDVVAYLASLRTPTPPEQAQMHSPAPTANQRAAAGRRGKTLSAVQAARGSR